MEFANESSCGSNHKDLSGNIMKLENEFDFEHMDDDSIRKMVFRSVEEAHRFYVEYSRYKGFKVTITGTKYVVGIANFRQMECNRGGYPRDRKGDGKRKLRVIKCNCPARLRVVHREMDNRYCVTNFVSHHNHELATVETADRKKIKRETEESFHLSDAESALFLVEAFKRLDPKIFCKHEMGENNSLAKFFWTDGFSREAYKRFGELLIFDSTYKTNNTYNLPIIILSGVDNHLKNVVFGVALIANETIGSYIWLLQKFLEAMGDKVPVSVLTDQQASLCDAISHVFPKAKQRLCGRHLERYCMKHGLCGAFGGLLKENSVEEFEENWVRLMRHYGVSDNSWIRNNFCAKENWSEAFFRVHFMGLNRIVQRSVLLDPFSKQEGEAGYTEFIKNYDDFLGKARSSFLKAQEDSESYEPQVNDYGLHKLRKHASSLYTKDVFHLVQQEIFAEQGLVDDYSYSRNNRQFFFMFLLYDEKASRRDRWSVAIDLDRDKFLCNCEMLESDGLPCRHLFDAFKRMRLTEIPSPCIRQRWTTRIGMDLKAIVNACPASRRKLVFLHQEFVKMALWASTTEARTEKCIRMLRNLPNVLRAKKSAEFHHDSTDEED